jgi:hypothetical protein
MFCSTEAEYGDHDRTGLEQGYSRLVSKGCVTEARILKRFMNSLAQSIYSP